MPPTTPPDGPTDAPGAEAASVSENRPGDLPAATPITVRYWAGARAAAGVDRETVPPEWATTVGAALDAVLERHPDLVVVLRVASFLVDGRAAVRSDPLRPGSVLEVLPPFAGG